MAVNGTMQCVYNYTCFKKQDDGRMNKCVWIVNSKRSCGF